MRLLAPPIAPVAVVAAVIPPVASRIVPATGRDVKTLADVDPVGVVEMIGGSNGVRIHAVEPSDGKQGFPRTNRMIARRAPCSGRGRRRRWRGCN